MVKYIACFFHIIIIAAFLGCGYKAPPSWEEKNTEINQSDLKIIDLNSTLQLKIGVK